MDQFGYRPEDDKIAILRDLQLGFDSLIFYTLGIAINVVDASTQKIVYSSVPQPHKGTDGTAIDTASGDKIWRFDFSSVTTPGSYYIQDASIKSFEFDIHEEVYNDVLKAALRILYYQRATTAKEAEYAGAEWADEVNHPQDAQARLFTDSTNASLERDVSGGWFDAGDYNKYTVWNGDYIETLLQAYWERPKAFTNDYNIPESGNGVPDILDEVKWGFTKEGVVGPAPGHLSGGPNSDYTWDPCCEGGENGRGHASDYQVCISQERPVGEPTLKMYRDLNHGWPLQGYSLTEPSLGYQTNFIHLLSKFVEEKGNGLGGISSSSGSSSSKSLASSSSAKVRSSSSVRGRSSSSAKKLNVPHYAQNNFSVRISHNVLFIHTSTNEKTAISIFDLIGNSIVQYTEYTNRSEVRIGLESLSRGVYLAHISSGNYSKTAKIQIR